MWRLAQLSRITGINYETLRYYYRSPKEGAGLIKASEIRGSIPYFDKDELFSLMIIEQLRNTDTKIENIQATLNGNVDFEEVIDNQINKLEEAIAETKIKITRAKLLKQLIKSVEDNNDDEIEEVFILIASNSLEETAFKLQNSDARQLENISINPAKTPQWKKLCSLYLEKKSIEAQENSIESLIDINKKFETAYEELFGPIGNAFSNVLERLIDFYLQGTKPNTKEVKEQFEIIYQAFSRTLEGMSAGAFKQLLMTVFSGNLLSIALELGVKEGITDYFIKAIDSYCNDLEENQKSTEQKRGEK